MASRSRAPATSARVRFDPPERPALVRAVSLGLAVLRHARCNTWSELAEKVQAGDEATLPRLTSLEVTDADSNLVAEHENVLMLLAVRPLLTVAVCPICGQWVLTGGPCPTRCTTGRRCPGKPVKASIAGKDKTG